MKTILKYEIKLAKVTKLHVPMGAEMLTVNQEGKQFFIWAIVNTESPMGIRTFTAIATGQVIDSDMDIVCVGVVQNFDGIVYHFFEVK